MVIAADATRQYTVPKSGGGRGRALVLALLMHVLLGLFLYFGLDWQSHSPEVIQAEMWSALPQVAAPRQTAPPPEPVTAPQPVPIKVVPPDDTPPPVKPDIEIKEPPKKEPPKKVVPPPPPPPPPAPVPAPPKADIKPTPAPTKPLPPAQPSQHNFDFDPVKPSTGASAVTSGPQGSPGYAAKLSAWVRPHVHSTAQGNPEVVVTIQLLPSGEVRDVKVKTPSGDPTFDDQAVRGVFASSPLPKDDATGKVVTPLELHIQNQN